jgi:hypothetical protein
MLPVVDGEMMVMSTFVLTPPDEAVTVTVPGVVAAEKIALTIPFAVVACGVIEPKAVLLRLKLTNVPSGTFAPPPVVTVAWIVDVPLIVKVVGVAVRTIAAAPLTPPPPVLDNAPLDEGELEQEARSKPARTKPRPDRTDPSVMNSPKRKA